MPQRTFTALILGGNRCSDDPVAVAAGASCKALAKVNGEPMIERVVDTLEKSRRVDEILVCLDSGAAVSVEAPRLAARLSTGALKRVDAGPSLSESVLKAIDILPEGKSLLVTTADHPLLTVAHVDDFINGAIASGADVATALAPFSVVDAIYPGARRTRFAFRDASYSGCNLFALMGPEARNAVEYWRQMENFRKRPWRLVVGFGPLTLAAFLSRQITLRKAFDLLEKRMNIRLHAVEIHDADAATDVDSLEDFQLVSKILAARNRSLPFQARPLSDEEAVEGTDSVLPPAAQVSA